LLAIVYALSKFLIYIYGSKVIWIPITKLWVLGIAVRSPQTRYQDGRWKSKVTILS
jgi:hypothetical protein